MAALLESSLHTIPLFSFSTKVRTDKKRKKEKTKLSEVSKDICSNTNDQWLFPVATNGDTYVRCDS